MARIDFTPAVILILMAVSVYILYYLSRNPSILHDFNIGINNLISGIFAIPPQTQASPPPPAPAPATPTPPAATEGEPAATRTCAERVGEACHCSSCCDGEGCDGEIEDKPAVPGPCSCNCGPRSEACGDGDGDGDDEDEGGSDDSGSGGGGGRSRSSPNTGPNAPGRTSLGTPQPITPSRPRCQGLTGQTRDACLAASARRVYLARRPRIGITRIFGVMNA